MGRIRSDQLKVTNDTLVVGRAVSGVDNVGASLPTGASSDVSMSVNSSDVNLTIQAGAVTPAKTDRAASWDFTGSSGFSIPAPQLANQATTKDYVDTKVSQAVTDIGSSEYIFETIQASTSSYSYTVSHIPQTDSSASDGGQYLMRVSLNGLELEQGTDYTVSLDSPNVGETTINLNLPYAVEQTDTLSVWLRRSGS